MADLNLSWNQLGLKKGAELVDIIRAISANVTNLDLSANLLSQKTGAELVDFISAIPTGVTHLNLSWNKLGKKSSDELALAFSKLHAQVNTLTLSIGDILGFSEADRDKIADSLAYVAEVKFTETTAADATIIARFNARIQANVAKMILELEHLMNEPALLETMVGFQYGPGKNFLKAYDDANSMKSALQEMSFFNNGTSTSVDTSGDKPSVVSEARA